MPKRQRDMDSILSEHTKLAAKLHGQAVAYVYHDGSPKTGSADVEALVAWEQLSDLMHLVHDFTENAPDEDYRLRYAVLDTALSLREMVRQLTRSWGVPEREAIRLVARAIFPSLQELRIWATTQSLGSMHEEGEA